MKTLKLLGLLGLLATAHTAMGWSQPCSQPWTFEIDYLYLKPSIGQSYFAVDSGPFDTIFGPHPAGKRYNNDLHFHSAYRLAAGYSFCGCNDFRLVWTHLPKFTQARSLEGNFLPTQGAPDAESGRIYQFASSKIDLAFYSLEALFGLWNVQQTQWNTHLSLGLHYARANFKEHLNYILVFNPTVSPTNDTLINRHHFSGIGPEISWDFGYGLPFFHSSCCECPLSLIAHLKGALLASKYSTDYSFVAIPETGIAPRSSAKNDSRWDLIPFWNIQFGLNYAFSLSCLAAKIEVGYIMLSYRDAINRIVFIDDFSDGQSLDNYSHLSFNGPYVSLGVCF